MADGTILNMWPQMTKLYSAYGFPVYAIVCCNNFFWSGVTAYIFNILLCKLGFAVKRPFPFAWLISSFINHIGHVFLVCSKEEVFRINARRIVAPVENKKSVGYFSIKKHIRCSVGFNSFVACETKGAVSEGAVFCASPQPTAFGFVDVTKKSLGHSSFWPSFLETFNSARWVFTHV